MARLELSLSNPGMSDLHKVGLGGLYMTLQSLDEKKKKINGFNYSLSDTGIILNFEDDKLGKALEELIKYSFQIDDKGFIYFPALELKENQPIENKLLNHQALLATFFQPTLKSSKVEKGVPMNFSGEEKRPIVLNFSKVLSYASMNKSLEMFYNFKKNKLEEEIEIINWLYPGGSVKHSALGDNTKLSEKVDTAFPLLFASIGCIYIQTKVSDSFLKEKIRATIVIPEIKSLSIFSKIRIEISQMGELKITMSGLSETALFLSQEFFFQQNNREFKSPYFTILGIGDTKWNTNQRSKNYVKKIKIKNLKDLDKYSTIQTALKSKIVIKEEEKDKKGNVKKPKSSYIQVSMAKELFCDNLANGEYFYKNFYKLVVPSKDSKGNLYYRIKYEHKELNTVIEKIEFDHESEKIFIKACHTAWRCRLGKLGNDSKNSGNSFKNMVDRDFERLRNALVKSKNLESFRETITDFWSRARNIPELSDGWNEVLPLLGPENWKKARDLALLALVSYKPEKKEEQDALNSKTDDKGEPHE